MRTVATARTTSTASPATVFAQWQDAAGWPEWSPDIEWVRLDGPVAVGTPGVMKLKGGPRLRFVVAALTRDREYTDRARLPGARVTFQHLVEPASEHGGSRLAVTVTIDGPLSFLWERVLGAGFRRTVPGGLTRLAELVERAG